MRRALIERTKSLMVDSKEPIICQANELIFKDSKLAKMIKANLLDKKQSNNNESSIHDGNDDYLNEDFRAAPTCNFYFHRRCRLY